jgi:hypothetical protein
MDVTPWPRCAIGFLIVCFSLVSCGNRYDLATERGRQARIDDANGYLSSNNCVSANAAIDPLYYSPFVDDQVRIIKASAVACSASFNFLKLTASLLDSANFMSAIAKSMTNTPNDSARDTMFAAMDVLTRNGSLPNAASRSPEVNTYMVFLQFGVIGAIIRNYGSPGLDGSQGANLIYDISGSPPAGNMRNVDACALPAAFSIVVDSFRYSGLTSGPASSAVTQISNLCGQSPINRPDCGSIELSRTACTGSGTDIPSQVAYYVVDGLNGIW